MSADAGRPVSGAAQLTRAFAAALERGDAEAAAACFADDAIYEEPPRFHFAGRAAIREYISDFTARHTDVRFQIERMLTSPTGDLLAAEWRFSHTRTRDGVHAAYAGMCFVELAGGRIMRWRGYSVASE